MHLPTKVNSLFVYTYLAIKHISDSGSSDLHLMIYALMIFSFN